LFHWLGPIQREDERDMRLVAHGRDPLSRRLLPKTAICSS
jgi:hypothetical protein